MSKDTIDVCLEDLQKLGYDINLHSNRMSSLLMLMTEMAKKIAKLEEETVDATNT